MKDGIYLIKKGAVYELHPRVKMLIGKSVNLKTGEVHYSTHADRIRNMSTEELARFIALQRAWYCDYKDPTEEEYPKALEYLRQEAKE